MTNRQIFHIEHRTAQFQSLHERLFTRSLFPPRGHQCTDNPTKTHINVSHLLRGKMVVESIPSTVSTSCSVKHIVVHMPRGRCGFYIYSFLPPATALINSSTFNLFFHPNRMRRSLTANYRHELT